MRRAAFFLLAGLACACRNGVRVAPVERLSGPVIDLYLELDAAVVDPPGAAGAALVRRTIVPALLGGEDAPALLCHPPGRVRFLVDVAEGARLVTTFHRPRAFVEQGSDGVGIAISVDGKPVLERFAAPADPDVLPVDVPLDAYRGRTVVLELEARAGAAGDLRYDTAYLLAPQVRQRVPAPAVAPEVALLVTIDTLRQDHLSADGHPGPLSPRLDRLARAGRLFARATAQANATTPSHAVILTGRAPDETGVYASDTPLPPSVPTLADTFRARGARTAAVVSVAHLRPEMSGLGRGFERFVPTDATRDAAATTDLALGLLSRHRGEPLFLWVHYFDPHTPYEPPAPWRELHGVTPVPDGPPLPARAATVPDAIFPDSCRTWLRDVSDPAVPRSWYAGEVSHVDHEIGRLLAALRAWGLGSRATMVVTADHGESFTEHGVYYGHAGLHEPQISVPLLLAGPGVEPAVVAWPAAHVDIFGALAGGGAEGLRGEAAADREIRTWHAHREGLALRRGDRKVVLPVEPFFALNRRAWQVDLATDALEHRPGSADAPEADALREAAADRIRSAVPPAKVAISEEELARLRELGYDR